MEMPSPRSNSAKPSRTPAMNSISRATSWSETSGGRFWRIVWTASRVLMADKVKAAGIARKHAPTVTAPSDALVTGWAYLACTPRVSSGWGEWDPASPRLRRAGTGRRAGDRGRGTEKGGRCMVNLVSGRGAPIFARISSRPCRWFRRCRSRPARRRRACAGRRGHRSGQVPSCRP